MLFQEDAFFSSVILLFCIINFLDYCGFAQVLSSHISPYGLMLAVMNCALYSVNNLHCKGVCLGLNWL